jgi:hypothetical protein
MDGLGSVGGVVATIVGAGRLGLWGTAIGEILRRRGERGCVRRVVGRVVERHGARCSTRRTMDSAGLLREMSSVSRASGGQIRLTYEPM